MHNKKYTKTCCISTHQLSKKGVKKKIPFTVASKRVKYLGMNLTKKVKDLYTENWDTDERMWKHELTEYSNNVRMPTLSNLQIHYDHH